MAIPKADLPRHRCESGCCERAVIDLAMSIVNGVVRGRADGRRQLGRPTRTLVADAKWRQANKIGEIRAAMIDAGLIALDEQAKALGLLRSTTWAILSGTHKASGLSASIVTRMLFAPDLPPQVRRKLLEYVREKFGGVYGHSPKQLRRYSVALIKAAKAGLLVMTYEQAKSPLRKAVAAAGDAPALVERALGGDGVAPRA